MDNQEITNPATTVLPAGNAIGWLSVRSALHEQIVQCLVQMKRVAPLHSRVRITLASRNAISRSHHPLPGKICRQGLAIVLAYSRVKRVPPVISFASVTINVASASPTFRLVRSR